MLIWHRCSWSCLPSLFFLLTGSVLHFQELRLLLFWFFYLPLWGPVSWCCWGRLRRVNLYVGLEVQVPQQLSLSPLFPSCLQPVSHPYRTYGCWDLLVCWHLSNLYWYFPVWEIVWYRVNARNEMYTNKIWLAKENTNQKRLSTVDYKHLWWGLLFSEDKIFSLLPVSEAKLLCVLFISMLFLCFSHQIFLINMT